MVGKSGDAAELAICFLAGLKLCSGEVPLPWLHPW